jgi:hypothetical protein
VVVFLLFLLFLGLVAVVPIAIVIRGCIVSLVHCSFERGALGGLLLALAAALIPGVEELFKPGQYLLDRR